MNSPINDLLTDAPQEELNKCSVHGEVLNFDNSCDTCVWERHQDYYVYSKWEKRYRDADIPVRHKECRFSTYDAKLLGQIAALKFAKEYYIGLKGPNKARSVFFTGMTGTGKTHLALAIAHSAMRRLDLSVKYTTVANMIRAVRETWNSGSHLSEREVMKVYMTVDLLILDEVGIQKGSDNELSILFEILNERYCASLPTIFISNLNRAKYESYRGSRIIDRLREDGAEEFIFDWDSYRSVLGQQAKHFALSAQKELVVVATE